MRIGLNNIGEKFLVAVYDLAALNIWAWLAVFATSLIHDVNWQLDGRTLSTLLSTGYFVGIYFVPIATDRLSSHALPILRRSTVMGIIISVFFLVMVSLLKIDVANLRHNLLVVLLSPLVLFVSRLIMKWHLAMWHSAQGTDEHLVFVGNSDAMDNLYHAMSNVLNVSIAGHFADTDSDMPLPRLGGMSDVLNYLRQHRVDAVYCDFTLDHAYLTELYMYCENHFIRFFGVPDVYGFLNRKLLVSNVAEVPVLAVREEALLNPLNRMLKRTFDIIFSAGVLLFLFLPIFCVVAIVISRKSPGPIFFCQKRTGMDGKDFWCLKFRSMHVNDQADTLQATENDPRKYPFGDFMRRTNIDELPQFINVFLGDMSIVGPRPHMLKHTEQYRALIGRYMVRHLAKPGITGWAQVNGLRGATKDVRDMERRVRHDIWYIEHWSFWLDIMIIIRTALLTFSGKSENAY